MNGVLSARDVPRSYKEDNRGNQVSSVPEFVKKRAVGRELEGSRHSERI
jgi:hypothetical protein